MKRSRATELKVGIFVIAALIIGSTLTFILGSQRQVFQSKVQYQAIFQSVDGLRAGGPVRIAGVAVGSVGEVDLRPDGQIHVTIGIIESKADLIRQDSVATIGSKGMLGDKLIEISPGQGDRLPPGGTIATESPVGLGEYVTKAGAILGDVEMTVQNLRSATEPLAEEQFAEDLRSTMRNVAEVTRMAAEEDGTVRRLLSDPQMADDVQGTVRSARRTSDQLAQTAGGVNAIVREIRSGDGTAHELIYGQEGRRLVSNLADATGEAAAVMRDVREGDGMLHDLIYEDEGAEAMDNVTAMTEDLRAIVADIRAGRGTIGGLLMDPSIYEDVKRLVGDLQRNEILRSLVRYSIRRDESQGPIEIEAVPGVEVETD